MNNFLYNYRDIKERIYFWILFHLSKKLILLAYVKVVASYRGPKQTEVLDAYKEVYDYWEKLNGLDPRSISEY